MKVNCNYSQNQNFKGRLILSGDMTPQIKKAFLENPVINEIAQKCEHNIIGNAISRIPSKTEIYRFGKDDIEYRLSLAVKDNAANIMRKIFKLINPPQKYNLSRNFHSESTNVRLINNLTDREFLLCKLGLKK